MTDRSASCDIILLAAGSSSRMGGVRKQFAEIQGQPVYQHALDSFRAHPQIGQIILVAPAADVMALQKAHQTDDILIVAGGAERSASVACGLAALQDSQADYIAIHDAARPFVPSHVIKAGLAALAQGHRAVIPVLRVTDTIKEISSNNERLISHSLVRERLRRVQTPQFFKAATIKALHNAPPSEAVTDDAMMAEAAGIDVITIDGDSHLDKITYPSDLATMKKTEPALMTDAPHLPREDYRTGTGFDVHRFKEGTGPIMICGLAVSHDKALDAHSDGDVGIHALCDAIFGALCDGDIGMHFPPSDDRWKDAASDQFLIYAKDKVTQAGARLVHIDVTILCERPKIGPHRDEMRLILARLCDLPLSSVSVKATTTEQLGFTGRQEGIAAQAAATIAMPAIRSHS